MDFQGTPEGTKALADAVGVMRSELVTFLADIANPGTLAALDQAQTAAKAEHRKATVPNIVAAAATMSNVAAAVPCTASAIATLNSWLAATEELLERELEAMGVK